MFTENTITVAARCNECCSPIQTEISIFSLSGGKIHAECPHCHSSALEISLSFDGKIRLSVPCVACPHPHPFTLSAETVFTKDIFILQCSFTRIDICFMGKKAFVEKELQKNGDELRMMMQDSGTDADTDLPYEEENLENLRVLLSFIEECAKDGNILCRCKSMKAAPGVEVQISEKDVSLVCKECGRKLVIPISATEQLEYYLELGKLLIDDDKRQ